MDDRELAKIERKIREKAKQRVKRRVGFYWHLVVFLLANGAMLAINLTQSPQYMWFVWPLAAWSAALLLHGFATFSSGGMTEAMIQAEIQRERERRGLA